MIISSEIENVEKVENLIKSVRENQKSILRAFARTRAKKKDSIRPAKYDKIALRLPRGRLAAPTWRPGPNWEA